VCGGVPCAFCGAAFVSGLVESVCAASSFEREVFVFGKWAAICVGNGNLVEIIVVFSSLSSWVYAFLILLGVCFALVLWE
jgi:hypothetical protein